MRALLFDPDGSPRLRLGEVPEPLPTESEMMIEVAAISLNFGELAFGHPHGATASVPGWDAAGTVIKVAANGSGPPVGTRVVTFGWDGGWAELRTVETANVAVVPDSVELGTVSALPVAGVSALQALRRLGPVIGRRVLVTGASGGVGRYAVQLATLAGAHVIASVGSPARTAGLSELGAAEVVVGLEGVSAPVFGVLDNVGGAQLADALALLEPGGVVQWIGRASCMPLTLEVDDVERHPPWRLERFSVAAPFGTDLAYLVGLLECGALDPQIGWRGEWSRASEAVDALLTRGVMGKAVLDVRGQSSPSTRSPRRASEPTGVPR